MAVAVEQPDGVVLLEVLPLKHRVGEDLKHALHEGLDELVVLLTTRSRLTVTHVIRVAQERLVVGPDIE